MTSTDHEQQAIEEWPLKLRRVTSIDNRLGLDGRGADRKARVWRIQVASNSFVGKVVLALCSAGVLTLALPEADLGWLAWVSLVPLLIACQGVGLAMAAALGFLFGTAANLGIYPWLFEVKGFEPYHFLMLSSYFALYPAAWCAAISCLTRNPTIMLLGPAAYWVGLDYVRANAGFMAFPWGTLAQTQHQNLPILQVATITGEYGVTFLVVLGSTAVARLVTERMWRSAAVTAAVIALVYLSGAVALLTADSGAALRVSAVQPSIQIGERDTEAGRNAILYRLDRLSRVAASSRPALIVWPETAVAGNLRTNPLLSWTLGELVNDIATPIVLGVGEVEKFATRDGHGNLTRKAYNSAYLMKPSARLEESYLKRVLLPFGGYVPLESIMGWPAWLTAPVFNTVVGDAPKVFKLDDGSRFAPLICWENLFAPLARESVREGANFLVLLTNDAWFGRSAAPRQHNLASVLRAVENRVPIVVSSNTGPSQIIDAYGRIVARAPGIFSEDVVVGDIKLVSPGTLYTRIGDAFVFIVIGALALVLASFGRQSCERH